MGYRRRAVTSDGIPRRLRDNQALLISQLPQDGDSEPRRPQGADPHAGGAGYTALHVASATGQSSSRPSPPGS